MKLLYLVLFLAVSLASAEEWSAPFSKGKIGHSKKVPGVVSEKLDFGAYLTADKLVVLIRNGKAKMGGRTITIKCADSPATLEVQRVRIAKPLSLINQKGDGTHFFDSFTNSDKLYEIYYHIKGGKLESKITIASKS